MALKAGTRDQGLGKGDCSPFLKLASLSEYQAIVQPGTGGRHQWPSWADTLFVEQIERVLSTGCMEWTNAEGRQPVRIEPGPGLCRAYGRLAFKPHSLADLERPFRGSIGRGGEDSCGGI